MAVMIDGQHFHSNMLRLIILSFVLGISICMSASSEKINDIPIDLNKLTSMYAIQKSKGVLPSDTICSAALYQSLRTSDWETGKKAYTDLQTYFKRGMGIFYSSVFEKFLSICVNELKLTVGEEDVRSYLKMRLAAVEGKRNAEGKILYETGIAVKQLGDSRLALEFLEQFLNYENDIDPIYFNRYLMDVGWTYLNGGVPQKAYMNFRKCAEYYRNKFGGYSKNYANALNSMAYASRLIGRGEETLVLCLKEKEILEHNGDTIGDRYAICLDNIASAYYARDEIEPAIEYAEKARSIFEKSDNEQHLAIVYNNLSAFYTQLADKDTCLLSKAEELLIQSLGLYPTSSAVTNLISLYDNELKNYTKSQELIDKWNDESKYYVDVDVAANHYALIGDYATYTRYMKVYIDKLRTVLQGNALFMSSEERNGFVKSIQESNLRDLFELAAKTHDSHMAALCYDYLLMTRSLLLSFDSSIMNIVDKTKNVHLRDMYFSLLVHRKNFEVGLITQDKLDYYEHVFLDSLAKERNFTDFTNLRMEDVSRSLRDKDVAVEFYKSATTLNASLYAVVLNNDLNPKVVVCCTADEELTLTSKGLLAENIASKLSTAIDGKKRVFFTPSGKLYTYPFESEICHRWPDTQFYRLTSSRELVLSKHHRGSGALIYGGLNYGLNTAEMKADSLRYSNGERSFDLTSQVRYADQIQPLPGTLREAILIKETYDKQKANKVQLFTGARGTESSFKAYSGQNTRVIHIGTHGFFLQAEESGVTNPLMRTGLLMSGAENYFYEEDIYNGNDDGILTAQEISTMDFRGLDLVTLSACETAKGDITGDGVFGLQRGFKKAGANSILMSLWKVDDEATCKLMTEFYSNWIGKKMTKHDALEAAKKTVRETKGWEDPKYWAAFILLDGLD